MGDDTKMDKTKILDALAKLRKSAKKRNFKQSVDFSVVLKEVDLRNPANQIDEFVELPKGLGKKLKICGLVDKGLVTQARELCDKVITKDEFRNWAGKKRDIKKLASEFDYFIAQATIMTDIAAVFGKFLGPKGKMPNPKYGGVIPPKFNIAPLIKKLQNTVKLQSKKQPVVSAMVGVESMNDEDLARNIDFIYDFVKRKLPRGEQQIKKGYIKFTMSQPVVL